MQAIEPTSWLLNGVVGWRTAQKDGVVAGEQSGLRLAFDPAGPLDLGAPDGSLGGLGLPRGMAIADDGTLYLLGRDALWIKRFDPGVRCFVSLPLIEEGRAAGRYYQPGQIACAGRRLYVADTGNRRVQVVDRASLGLRYTWQIAAGDETPAPVTVRGPQLFVGDPGGLARQLGHGLDPLSSYLARRLPAKLRDRVERLALGVAPVEEQDELELGERLGEALDAIAASPEAIYSEQRFRKVRLSATTSALLARNPEGADFIRLQVRLIAEAYPALVAANLWLPVDLAARGDAVYILDRRYGRVYRHGSGADALELVVDAPDLAGRLSRVLVDRPGAIYVLDGDQQQLYRCTCGPADSSAAPEAVDPGDVRDRFATPAIRLDHRLRFCVPASLARLCARGAPTEPPSPAHPLAACGVLPQPPAADSALLEQRDIVDLPALAGWLQRRARPAARFLYGQLTAATLKWIDLQDRQKAAPAQAPRGLLDDLNAVLQSKTLADAPGFRELAGQAPLRQLSEQRPHGAALVRLNRLLLEAACPAAFAADPSVVSTPLIFDLNGQHQSFDPSEPAGPYVYCRHGSWYSRALDSQLYGCQWHRIELQLLDLPPGTQVIVRSFADAQAGDGPFDPSLESLWDLCDVINAPSGPPGPLAPAQLRHEFLVQSRAGQHLWLQIELVGDGYATPAVEAVRVHYPRQSYLRHLPAVYSADDESRWFLERFLAVFQTEWDALERTASQIEAFFDPRSAPAEAQRDFVAYLASWLALPLEGAWSAEQRRRLLVAAPRIYSVRGTAQSLRAYLQVYLENMTGLPPADQIGFPCLVEGFRERGRALLTPDGGAGLSEGAPLWGAGQVGRIQLDRFSREGEVRLVSTGDPERDLFHEYAHRFRLFVPGAWVRTAADERMLRRAVDAERPSHTRFDLVLVEPRLRVGVQSTVGLDTIVGGYPPVYLAHHFDDTSPEDGRARPEALKPAPSAAPRCRLGYDTILARRPPAGGGMPLTARTRVGVETVIS